MAFSFFKKSPLPRLLAPEESSPLLFACELGGLGCNERSQECPILHEKEGNIYTENWTKHAIKLRLGSHLTCPTIYVKLSPVLIMEEL